MKEAKQYNAYSEDLQVLVQALPERIDPLKSIFLCHEFIKSST